MTNLSAKNEALLVLMAKDAEHARRGFELILKRSDADKYFDALIEKGFFKPNQDPPVVEAEKKGQYYIPFWDALGYLNRIATLAGERHDIHIATKVIEIVQAIGRAQKSKGEAANYRTSLALADIIGVLPLLQLARVPGFRHGADRQLGDAHGGSAAHRAATGRTDQPGADQRGRGEQDHVPGAGDGADRISGARGHAAGEGVLSRIDAGHGPGFVSCAGNGKRNHPDRKSVV